LKRGAVPPLKKPTWALVEPFPPKKFSFRPGAKRYTKRQVFPGLWSPWANVGLKKKISARGLGWSPGNWKKLEIPGRGARKKGSLEMGSSTIRPAV